jgi:hypothetical protein
MEKAARAALSATATKNFLGSDFLNRCGRAYPHLLGAPEDPKRASV